MDGGEAMSYTHPNQIIHLQQRELDRMIEEAREIRFPEGRLREQVKLTASAIVQTFDLDSHQDGIIETFLNGLVEEALATERAALQQPEREHLHRLLQEAYGLIDPEEHPEWIAECDAVLLPCDEAGRCVPLREAERASRAPEPPPHDCGKCGQTIATFRCVKHHYRNPDKHPTVWCPGSGVNADAIEATPARPTGARAQTARAVRPRSCT